MLKTARAVGMTLIECMLALTLSGFILSAIFEIYFMSEKNRLVQRDVIILQKNAFTVTQLIKEYVRRAGHTGCAKLTNNFPFKNNLEREVSVKNKIMRYVGHDVKPGTDAIQIEYLSLHHLSLVESMQESAFLSVTHGMHVKVGDEWVITDCQSAEAFRVKEVMQQEGVQVIVPDKPLAKLYEKNTILNKFERDIFLVSASPQKNSDGSRIYGFYKKNGKEKMELVSGVEEMKVTYSALEDQQLLDHPLAELHDASMLRSLSFALQLKAGSLHKSWYVYAALP